MPAQELTKTDEEKMVDLDVSGPAVDVELPQEGAVITEVGEEAEADAPEIQVESAEETNKTEELENYSKNVKRRIDKLTAKLREAERREQAATTFAESVKKENENLKNEILMKRIMEAIWLSMQTELQPKQRQQKQI